MSSQEVEKHTEVIQELVLGALNKAVAVQLVDSIDVYRKSVIGTLQRCVEALEEDDEEHDHRAHDSLKQVRIFSDLGVSTAYFEGKIQERSAHKSLSLLWPIHAKLG